MSIETINIESATLDELYEAAKEYGYNVASWQNLPEIGDSVPKDIDWIGIDVVEDEEDQREVLSMYAHAGEENNRCFSPAEFWISALNRRKDSEEAWEMVDSGISDGIEQNINERI